MICAIGADAPLLPTVISRPASLLIITADHSLEVLAIVRRRGLHCLRSPVKPAKLRALVSHLLARGRPRPSALEHPSMPIS
jgi:hypothetical protein